MFYKDAGVNINRANESNELIKGFIKSTFTSNVLSNFGSFGGLFEIDIAKYKNPVLVSSTDGVGTKIKISIMMNKYSTIGIDLVSHSVNDILVQGASPLFFLDYIGMGQLEPNLIAEIVKGLSIGCKEVGCALIGGETAEMPSIYQKGDYDLVGCIIGIVEKNKIITGEKIKEGDVIIGLNSNGLHTNGYSLARKILFEKMKYKIDTFIPELNTTIGEELLKTHTCYSKIILPLLDEYEIKGIAHITGGGFIDNIPRILPNVSAKIFKGTWQILPIFDLLQKLGQVPELEMYRTFNMGIGLVIIVDPKISDKILELTNGKIIGEIVQGTGKVEIV
ncbi:MAG: phosphoribosylformylglycinamidine cyclo-ligase [bacterium]